VNNSILNHVTGLTRFRASRYFARLPSRTAESGSLALCTVHFLSLPSDPAVARSALAIRIVFPLAGVTPAYRRLGLPAMPGKQKKALISQGFADSSGLAGYYEMAEREGFEPSVRPFSPTLA
jgi:hypothetical protein